MYYYLKTDVGPKDYPDTMFRKGHWWGLVEANSPEEAEHKFKRHLSVCLAKNSAGDNRTEASKRLLAKDFEVEEYIPSKILKDPNWNIRVNNATRTHEVQTARVDGAR